MANSRTRLRDRRSVLLFAWLALVPTAGAFATAGQANPPAELSWALEDFVNEVRAAETLPGLAIVVVHSDGLPQVFVSGERRIGKGDRMMATDRMHLGSLTKAITASVIGALVEQGRMTFDTTIGEMVPLVPKMRPEYRLVTVRQLLAHAGGIPTYHTKGSVRWTFDLRGTMAEHQRAFFVHVLGEKPRFPAGAKHEYSNAGSALTGAMAERAAGRPWRVLVQDLVFGPLGATAEFGAPGLDASPQPWGHVRVGAHHVKEVSPTDQNYVTAPVLDAAGNASPSLPDYGRFLQLHLRGLRGRDDVLKATTIRALHTRVPPDDPKLGFAMGWGIATIDGVETHRHGGSAGAYVAIAMIQPSRDLAVAILTNIGGGVELGQRLERLARLIAARATGSRKAG